MGSHDTGASVLLWVQVSYRVNLLVSASLHQAVAIRSSGCGSSEVLPVKGLQFWSSAPFSWEGEEKKSSGLLSQIYWQVYLFLMASSEAWSLSGLAILTVWLLPVYDQWWQWNYLYYLLLSHLCPVCAVTLLYDTSFSLLPLSVGVPRWVAFS